MDEQARLHDFTHLRTGGRVEDFVKLGLLVRLTGNSNYHLGDIAYPFVRPEVKLFVERMSAQARRECGGDIYVTSSTRPMNAQPRNASPKSVHPTGMAVDFRVPKISACKAKLERLFLELEGNRVLEATRERRPPHYHVAIFPQQYSKYVAAKSAPKRPAKPVRKTPPKRK